MNTITNELPNLRERFGDVSLSGAERLLRVGVAQGEIQTSVQEALHAIAARLNPKPKKDIDIGELLRRAVDKGDAEARALANLLSTWSGKVTVQFTADLEAPRFVPLKDELEVWSGLAGSERLGANEWDAEEVRHTLNRALLMVREGSPNLDALDYARAAVCWSEIVFGPENGDEVNAAVWNGCEVEEALAANLEKIARRLNLVRHAPPPPGFFFVLVPKERVLPELDCEPF